MQTSATKEPVNTPLATIAVTAVSQLQGHSGVESCSLILPLSHRARGVHREAGSVSSAERSTRGKKCYRTLWRLTENASHYQTIRRYNLCR